MTSRALLVPSIFAAALLAAASASAEEATPAATCSSGHPELARGFSLTGWFDEPVARPPDLVRLRALSRRGFTHVRLPVAAESVMTRFSRPAEIAARRRAIGTGLDALAAAGFAVVVDLHGGAQLEALLRRDPKAARAAVIEAWGVLGPLVEARVARKVSAEVLNEPPLDDAAWRATQATIVAAMRREMPTATFVVSTGGPQRVERLTASAPIADANTVYAVHYYDPMVFTHQGADWIRPDPIGWLHDVPFPIRAGDPKFAALLASFRATGPKPVADYLASLSGRSFGVADVERDMRALGAWSRKYGRDVVIGEFGVYRARVAPADRVAWLAAVAGAAARNCIGWTHWDYRDGFGFVDAKTGEADEAVLSALFGRRSGGASPRS
ncbi:glycoside hydrolase family 5 protein [Pinisolibacter sp.]|uniref:glycoside hydrolase family 5 protein n=1 Tax=Pinisolibacter sp. TaxID=2172024 RepID=UPI002FDDEA00